MKIHYKEIKIVEDYMSCNKKLIKGNLEGKLFS